MLWLLWQQRVEANGHRQMELLTLFRYPSLNSPAPQAITGHNLSHLPFSVRATLPRRTCGSATASTSAGFSCDVEGLGTFMMASACHFATVYPISLVSSVRSASTATRRRKSKSNQSRHTLRLEENMITVGGKLVWAWRRTGTNRAAGSSLVFICPVSG